ncbi:MAG: transcriptional repressor LexA [Planctomycetota bacterium]|nr:transcriptional repressor LexA [Planctomycetota bacterium]
MVTGAGTRVFEYVRERILAGSPPTVREVQQHFKYRSVATAQQHLEALVRKGQLERLEGKDRGFRLPDAPTLDLQAVRVPLLGRVQAGHFQPAVEDLEGYVWVDGRHGAGELFALRVHGESMRDAHILPGDVVLVKRQPDAEHGQIVVAMVDDEATVKTLRKRGARIELHPANPAFTVLRPDPERLSILGRVVEIRRAIA